MKKYRTLKDLPGIPSGTESKEVSHDLYYTFVFGNQVSQFSAQDCKIHTDFFEPVIDYEGEIKKMGWVVSQPNSEEWRAIKESSGFGHIVIYAESLKEIYELLTINNNE